MRFPFSAITATFWPAARPAGACSKKPACRKPSDFALISQAATLRSRIPFVHFFDGFRTSHEVQKIEALTDADLRALIDDKLIAEHRARAMTPDHPVLRGTAQNPDVFFRTGPRGVQFVLCRLPENRARRDGSIRQGRGPRLQAV